MSDDWQNLIGADLNGGNATSHLSGTTLPWLESDKISGKQIAKAIRDLFSTGFFENVEVKLEKNILVITVVERPSIGAIEITSIFFG